jgi:hypothetical protein
MSTFRNDLEFFIPQLCSFYLKGNYEKPHELYDLILLASSASFYFSHRVWFFFQSVMYQDLEEDVYKKYSYLFPFKYVFIDLGMC